ncbi:MAG: hypothetical protein IJ650_02160 [Paludibacteraceae bacterium]|nr:hypothetical protein [Paludibacteraceae bacterium]
MKKTVLFALMLLAMVSCNTKQKQLKQAEQRVAAAQQMVECGNLNAAKLQLDSVHLLYPKQVQVRRRAKALMDSIVYIEAKRNLQYSDSLLQPLLPEVDKMLRKFYNEKNGEYEFYGRYVHKQLPTDRNFNRCFLQAYVNEDIRIAMKSYYCGQKAVNHESLTLTVGEEYQTMNGKTHSFETDGNHYEILNLEEQDAISALKFIAAHDKDRIKVTLGGSGSNYVYYLNQTEKQALAETCQLALAMLDVRQLEQQINIAQAQIDKYENKH